MGAVVVVGGEGVGWQMCTNVVGNPRKLPKITILFTALLVIDCKPLITIQIRSKYSDFSRIIAIFNAFTLFLSFTPTKVTANRISS